MMHAVFGLNELSECAARSSVQIMNTLHLLVRRDALSPKLLFLSENLNFRFSASYFHDKKNLLYDNGVRCRYAVSSLDRCAVRGNSPMAMTVDRLRKALAKLLS